MNPFDTLRQKQVNKRSVSAASWTDKGQEESTRVETQEDINHSALFFTRLAGFSEKRRCTT